MSKQINYYVIGGQYESVCYGGAPTLLGAKRLAGKNMEYWDNWNGLHRPHVYRAEDTEVIESRNRCTTRDGEMIRVPKQFAEPLY